MSDKITREKFIERVGRAPEMDDLERCNCPKAGKPGHWGCGWNEELDLPNFMVGIEHWWGRPSRGL
jgi:hypothetical protein